MSGEQIVIDHELFVTAIISGFTFLVAACGSLIAMLGKMLFNKLDKKIDQCSRDLSIRMDDKFMLFDQKMEMLIKYNEETRKSTYHSHDRITAHVEKHHTKV